MTTLNIDHFIYRPESATTDWPLYKQRLEMFFLINSIGFKLVTPDTHATPPVAGETTAVAHGYLMVLGGPKIVEINNASAVALNYVTLTNAVTDRFTAVNPRIADFKFRSCVQLDEESLADYSSRLHILAAAANIAADQRSTQVLSVIMNMTMDHETRLKCLDENTTLELLLSWRKNTDLKQACSYAMGAQRAQNNVLNVTSKSFKRPQSRERERQRPDSLSNSSQSSISEQQCFLCGYEYPHKGECPAKGKRCSNCGKANHFKKMCKSGSNNNSSNSRSNYNNNRSNHHGTNDRTPNNNFNRYGGSPTRSMLRQVSSSNSLNYNTSNRRRSPIENSGTRHIEDLSEDELLEEFKSFFDERQRLTSSTVDSQSIRSIINSTYTPQIESINEMSDADRLACPRTYIQIGRKKINHLVDTGTNLNIISSSTYDNMKSRPVLQPTSVSAFGFHSKTAIPLLGEFTCSIKFRHKSITARYLVLDGNAEDIIGFSTATALGIVKIECDNNPELVNTIGTPPPPRNNKWCPRTVYPELFTGKIGNLRDFKISLDIDHSVRPIQQPSYPVEFALYDLCKEKIDSLVEQGILSRINGEHVTWICPMHPVGKFNDKGKLIDVRITCNAKTFNKALIPAKRHIPSVPELTRQLTKCKWFSIIDFKDAFNQLSYDEQARALNVMSTPWGLYCWNRLNMGIATASELFQEVMEKVLAGIDGIVMALDDGLVFSETEEQHSEI